MHPQPDPLRHHDVFAALSLLTPFDTNSMRKVRVGPAHDGGYVMFDDFDETSALYSFGIGTQIEYDEQIAARGIPVFMFDHTIDGIPRAAERLHFAKSGLGGANNPDEMLYTLEHYVSHLGHLKKNDMALKIDIEGAEFSALNAAPDEILCKFRQLVLELHWLSKLSDEAYRISFIKMLNKINKSFTLCHVHANNCVPLTFVGGHCVADVLELTFIRSDLIEAIPSQTVYPTRIDAANAHWAADHLLWFYPFLPMTASTTVQIRGSYNSAETTLRKYRAEHQAENRDNEMLVRETILNRQNWSQGKAPKKSRKLNILYFSCHEILEFDDLKMFTDDGHKVFSLGSYSFKKQAEGRFRNPLPSFFDPDLEAAFVESGSSVPGRMVTADFVKMFDIAIVNHYPEWIVSNMRALQYIPVVLRTIGQSGAKEENIYKNLGESIYISRYSPKEKDLPGFAKTDDVIYFCKDSAAYLPWSGNGHGLTFHNSFIARDSFGAPKLSDWRQVASQVPMGLYGAGNDGIGESNGLASPDRLSVLLAQSSFYFYVYTRPPSYTLSLIEALTAGVPILAPSIKMIESAGVRDRIDDRDLWVPERYEIPSLLDGAGLTYDTVDEAIDLAQKVSKNKELAARLSHAAVSRATHLFAPTRIAAQWQALFDRIV